MPFTRQPLGIDRTSPGLPAGAGGLALVPTAAPTPAADAAILIVARRTFSRRLLTRVFREAGMSASAVETAAMATVVEEIAQGVDGLLPVVVVDARPAGEEGFALAARIREHREAASARLVLLLTSGTRGDAARCRALDVSAYLTKPLRPSDLVAAIRTVLETGWRGPAAPLVTRHLVAGRPEPLHILLAEDEASIRFLVTRVLEKRGHSVVAAANGREALAALERGSFDVLLTDMGLPELDGRGLLRAVRERERERGGGHRLPVVALTGEGPGDRRAAAGWDGYVGKPFSPEEVFFTLESVTGGSGSREARARCSSNVLDRGTLVSEVGGDVELLRRMVSMFREDWPRRVAQLRDAVRDRSGQSLSETAHALKGSIGIFRAADAFETARRLEFLGRRDDFAAAGETLESLEEKLRVLETALGALVEEETT